MPRGPWPLSRPAAAGLDEVGRAAIAAAGSGAAAQDEGGVWARGACDMGQAVAGSLQAPPYAS